MRKNDFKIKNNTTDFMNDNTITIVQKIISHKLQNYYNISTNLYVIAMISCKPILQALAYSHVIRYEILKKNYEIIIIK